jgi:DNA-binding MarR family transcriptional regulator
MEKCFPGRPGACRVRTQPLTFVVITSKLETTMKLREEIKQTKPFASLEEETFLSLLRTAGCLSWRWAEAMKPWGLSTTQYNALRILRGAGNAGLACSEIGARMVTQESDITRLLDRLEKKGLVVRARDSEDRRVVMAHATKKALAILAEMDGPQVDFVRKALGGLGARRLEELNASLERLRE